MGTLYIVATPIGNLEDMTLRALRVLKEVDLILCEDTRVTKKLLAKYDIRTRTESYHAHTKITKAGKFLDFLAEVKNIALVSDAGTAAISAAGIPAAQFIFLGFLPHKKGRETMFRRIADSSDTVIFYESPHRIMKSLV